MPAASSFWRRSSRSRLRVVPLAQLLLDGLQLLAQVKLALALRKLALHLRLDASAQLHQFQLAGQVAVHFVQPRLAIGLLEQFLAFRRFQGGQGSRNPSRPAGPVP